MRAINAGLGRTGTHSLKAAFQILGLAPAYSAEMMWTEPGHAEAWSRACDGEAVDWKGLLATYRSGVDWPICSFWREITSAFPNVRVILSTRDPGEWYTSFHATVYAALTTPAPTDPMPTTPLPVFQRLPDLGARVIAHGLTADLGSRTAMIGAYQRHYAAVRAEVPGERLLEWDISQGWEPLCAFLEIPVPPKAFPHVNDRSSYRDLLGLREGDASRRTR